MNRRLLKTTTTTGVLFASICVAFAAGCVETRVLTMDGTAAAPAPVEQPVPAHLLPPQGGDRASPSPDRAVNRGLALALLSYLDTKKPSALKPLDTYAARPGDMKDHQHHQAMIMVAVGQLLRGIKPRFLTMEQKVVATFLVPRAGGERWLRDMLMSQLDRQLTNRSDTAFRQIKDGHFTLSSGLARHLRRANLVTIPAGSVVADVGCGVGSQTVELARMVGRRGKVFAVDIDPGVIAFLEHLRSLVPTGKRIVPRRSVPEDIGLSPKSLDLAMIHGINFLFRSLKGEIPHHATSLIWSIHSALKPGGHLLIRSYLATARLSAFITRCGFNQVGFHASRTDPVKGPNGQLLEDKWVLFRRND